MKKYILLSFLFILSLPSLAGAKELPVYFFWGEGCPYCENQKPFMEELKADYPEIKVISLETWKDRDNQVIMMEAGNRLGMNITGVPFTIIGDDYVSGFGGADSSGREMRELIEYCLENDCPDILEGADLGEVDLVDIDASTDEDQLAKADRGTNWPVMLAMISLPLFLVIFLVSSNRDKKA